MKILDKTTQTYKKLVLKPGGDTLPIGGIIAFDSDTIPNGWLLCDGRAVSRTKYAELFKAIGTKHGSGDGSTTFNLPNPKGRTLVGKDSTDTDFNTLGKTGGEKTHTLTRGEMPKHDHDVIGSVGTISGGERYYTMPQNGISDIQSGTIGTSTENGGGKPHNNLQPYLVTNFIIKAKNTTVVKGEIIQEDGTASETNVYSASAMDNKLKTNIVTGQEVATNEYIDGKQVFVKRINCGNLPNATGKLVSTGLTNVTYTDIKGIATKGDTLFKLPYISPNALNASISLYISGNAIEIDTGIDRSAFTGEVTIYYTKN